MKNWPCVISSVIVVLFGAMTATAASTLQVSVSGIDSSTCGRGSPCRSISQAMSNAAAGDTINVGPGRYGDVNGDGNFTGPGDEQPDPNAGATLLSPGIPAGCIVCITKPLHIYSLQGAATTVISSNPSSAYGSTVMIESDGVDFGSVGHGFSLTGGNNNGVAISLNDYTEVISNISVSGNVDLGDTNGFGFYGYTYNNVRFCPEGECHFSARILFSENQAINNVTGFNVVVEWCCLFGSGPILLKDNLALGAGTGFSVSLGPQLGVIVLGIREDSVVQVLNNVAEGGVVGFSASSPGAMNYNTAINNSQAGFGLVGGGQSFSGNSAIANGGPGAVIDWSAVFSWSEFVPFVGNNFVGNDRKGAHCGVLVLPQVTDVTPVPPATPLLAAGNYWGSSNGPSSTGPGDAAGGVCDQDSLPTVSKPFSKVPFAIKTSQ